MDGIHRALGPGAVSSLAPDGDLEGVRRRRHRSRLDSDGTQPEVVPEVQAEDGGGNRIAQDPLTHHELGPGVALLGGLKDELDGAPPQVRVPLEGHESAQEDGRVAVVAAGVHDAVVDGLVGQVAGLLDGERVHVGAQGDAGTIVVAQESHDARAGHRVAHLQAEAVDPGQDIAGGFLLLEAQLRVLVEVPPEFDHGLLEGGHGGVKVEFRHGQIRRRSSRRGGPAQKLRRNRALRSGAAQRAAWRGQPMRWSSTMPMLCM